MDALEILARLAETGTPPNDECALKMSVGLDQTIRRFEDETLSFAKEGGADLRFIFAPYGRGKTHLLWSLRQVAKKKNFVTAYVDCHSGQSPFESLQKTYQMIASAMVPPSTAGNDSGRLKTGVDAVIESCIQSVGLSDAKNRILDVFRDRSLAADFRSVVAAYARLVLTGNVRGSPAEELKAMMRADPSFPVKVSDLYKSHKWLPRPIGKLARRNAASWVRSLYTLPSRMGFPGLIVFFDETEQTLSLQRMSKKNRQVCLANLRNLVDHVAMGSFQGCVVYYAVVEELLEVARFELDALRQRLERIKFSSENPLKNPRAVWVDLDELTEPGPSEEGFFKELGQRILRIAMAAGLSSKIGPEKQSILEAMSKRYSESISVGAVREFVKETASFIAQGVIGHG